MMLSIFQSILESTVENGTHVQIVMLPHRIILFLNVFFVTNIIKPIPIVSITKLEITNTTVQLAIVVTLEEQRIKQK